MAKKTTGDPAVDAQLQTLAKGLSGARIDYNKRRVEYKVRGKGTKSTRYVRLGETANLTPHARETDNAADPINKKAGEAVRAGITIPDLATYDPGKYQAPAGQSSSAQDIITDPVTGNKYSKGASGNYESYTPPPPTPSPSQASSDAPMQQATQDAINPNPQRQAQTQAGYQALGGAQPAQAQAPQVQPAVSEYAGGSIVDFLNSTGKPSDFATRTRLATENGIPNYTGTAAQNTQLLNSLRTKGVQPAPPPPAPKSSQKSDPDSALAGYGYELSDTAQDSFKIAPAKSFQEVYSGVIKSLGANDVRDELEDITKKINSLDQEEADKVSDINENPWLTEGVRVSQIQKLRDRYELKRAPLSSNLEIYTDLYKTARDEAQYIATQTLNQYNNEREFQMDQIQLWMDQAEKLAKAQEKQSISEQYGTGMIGEYNFAKAQGYTGSFTQYQNEDANRKRVNTNITVTGADKDVFSANDAGSQLSAARGSDGYTDPYLYARLRSASRLSPSEFNGKFRYLVNPASYGTLGLTARSA